MKHFLLFLIFSAIYNLPMSAQVDNNQQTMIQSTIEKPPPPPLPPPPPRCKEEVRKVITHIPRFPGCEDSGGTKEDKRKCANEKMKKFLYQNLQYPLLAQQWGIEGTCIISFIVRRDGKVANTKIVRDIGGGCGKEALRVIDLMNKRGLKWTPGPARGWNINIQFELPVTFELKDD